MYCISGSSSNAAANIAAAAAVSATHAGLRFTLCGIGAAEGRQDDEGAGAAAGTGTSAPAAAACGIAVAGDALRDSDSFW